MSIRHALPLLLLASLPFASCSSRPGQSSDGSSGATAASRPSASAIATATGVGVVAEVDGSPILASELEAKLGARLVRLRQEEYEIRRRAIDEIVAERLLDAEAAKRGISREELLRREVERKAAPVLAEFVDAIYKQNKERFASRTKDEALKEIRSALEERARSERQRAFENELRSKARVAVRLEAPRAGAVEIPADAPVKGKTTAAVTIVEFTDYQCPYCHRAQAVMDQILSTYESKVRLVHRDFPLDGHPGAVPAARAARCAGEQGKFWEYHHDLMTVAGTLDKADLEARAAKLGLGAGGFASCLASGRFDEKIRASFAQGESLGVTGTPAYFVNGRMISGAQPFEQFAQVIDAELAPPASAR